MDPSRLERVFVRWASRADGGLMSLIVLFPTPWRRREVKSSLSFWNLKGKSGGTVFSQESVILEGGDFKCTQMILTPRWQGKGERERETQAVDGALSGGLIVPVTPGLSMPMSWILLPDNAEGQRTCWGA